MKKKTIVNSSIPTSYAAFQQEGERALAPGSSVTIGSGRQCDIRLSDDPSVSHLHARLAWTDNGWALTDLRSTNGTFVGGYRLRRVAVLPHRASFAIGGSIFLLDGHRLTYGPVKATEIRAVNVEKYVEDDGGIKRILDNVSITIQRGELVAIIGGSGSGKSSLLNVLAERDSDWTGTVLYDGQPLNEVAEQYRPRVGFVPQHTIAHRALTVEEALTYGARLSLPSDRKKTELQDRIDKALDEADLDRDQPNRRVQTKQKKFDVLSGGQLKRACLAMELLRDLKLLFLDEVTSGLDVDTEATVMASLRELSRKGTTVVCVTHYLSSLDQCDRVLFMGKDGRLLFNGPPSKLTGVNLRAAFRQDPTALSLLAAFSDAAPTADSVDPVREPSRLAWLGRILRRVGGFLRSPLEWWWLTARHVRLLSRDWLNTLFLAVLAPLILTRSLCILTNSMPSPDGYPSGGMEQKHLWAQFLKQQQMLAFGAVLTVIFLGLFATVQVIVKERDIYKHEHQRGSGVLSYIASKLIPMSALGLCQAASIVAGLHWSGTLDSVSTWDQLKILGTASLVAVHAGLALSAWIPEPKRGSELDGTTLAIMAMNLLVIPQILFTNAFVTLEGLASWIAALVSSNWSYEAFNSLIRSDIGARVPEVLHALDQSPMATPPSNHDLAYYLKLLFAHGAAAMLLLLGGMYAKDYRRANSSAELKEQYAQRNRKRARSKTLKERVPVLMLGAIAVPLLVLLMRPLEQEWKQETSASIFAIAAALPTMTCPPCGEPILERKDSSAARPARPTPSIKPRARNPKPSTASARKPEPEPKSEAIATRERSAPPKPVTPIPKPEPSKPEPASDAREASKDESSAKSAQASKDPVPTSEELPAKRPEAKAKERKATD